MNVTLNHVTQQPEIEAIWCGTVNSVFHTASAAVVVVIIIIVSDDEWHPGAIQCRRMHKAGRGGIKKGRNVVNTHPQKNKMKGGK